MMGSKVYFQSMFVLKTWQNSSHNWSQNREATPSKAILHYPIWHKSTWSDLLMDLFAVVHLADSFVSACFFFFFCWHYQSSKLGYTVSTFPKLGSERKSMQPASSLSFGWLSTPAGISRPQHNIPKNGEPGTSIFQFPCPAARYWKGEGRLKFMHRFMWVFQIWFAWFLWFHSFTPNFPQWK